MTSSIVYNINQLRDFSSIFKRNEVVSWLKRDFSSLDSKIERYSNKIPKTSKLSYLSFVKYAYSVLDKNYQNEYIFKNSFLTDWVIKELGATNSIVFSEFRAGNSITDLAMFNGISKAFEIKTEFDTDARLAGQIKEYKRMFNEIYLIIPKKKFPLYKKYSSDLGIILFDSSKEERFELVHKSKFQEEIDPNVIMENLHTNEYKDIVIQYFGELPKMNSFNQYNVCFDLIKLIPLSKLNQLYINQIKIRKYNTHLSNRNYKEFNQICLALKLPKEEKMILVNNLKTPINF